jgi:hypothetical protein
MNQLIADPIVSASTGVSGVRAGGGRPASARAGAEAVHAGASENAGSVTIPS